MENFWAKAIEPFFGRVEILAPSICIAILFWYANGVEIEAICLSKSQITKLIVKSSLCQKFATYDTKRWLMRSFQQGLKQNTKSNDKNGQRVTLKSTWLFDNISFFSRHFALSFQSLHMNCWISRHLAHLPKSDLKNIQFLSLLVMIFLKCKIEVEQATFKMALSELCSS